MTAFIPNRSLRQFGYIIAFVFSVLIGFILPAFGGHSFRLWTLWVSIPFFLLGLLFPRRLIFIYKVWMGLGSILGWINSRIILGLIFILILQPIAFVMKLFGYDPLQKHKTDRDSYREVKDKKQFNFTRIF